MYLSDGVSFDELDKLTPWRRMSQSFRKVPRKLSSRSRRTSHTRSSLDRSSLDRTSVDHSARRRSSLDRASLRRPSFRRASLDRASVDRASLDRPRQKPRSFLGYGFVWTGATLCGYLVRLRDLDFGVLCQSRDLAESFSDAGDLAPLYASQLEAVTSRSVSAIFASLVHFLAPLSRADFAAKLAMHAQFLPSWRAATRPARDSRELRDGGGLQALCLLETGAHGRSLRRDRFCELSAVSVRAFDFRPEGRTDNIGRAASIANGGTRISCAAMIVLLEIEDEIGCEFGVCGLCERLSSEEKRIRKLMEDIMNMYDERPGGRLYR